MPGTVRRCRGVRPAVLRIDAPDGGRDVDRPRAGISRHGDIIIAPDRGLPSVAPGRGCAVRSRASRAEGGWAAYWVGPASLRWVDAPALVRARDPRRRCRESAVAALTPRPPEVPAGPHGHRPQPPAEHRRASGPPRGPAADRGDGSRARGRGAGA